MDPPEKDIDLGYFEDASLSELSHSDVPLRTNLAWLVSRHAF